MKISTRSRYGTRVLLELALHWGEGPVLLKDIAQRQHIPLPYLQQLIGPLTKKRIIMTSRGPRGGISLLKPPNEVRLSEVVQLLDGSIARVKCVDNPEICSFSGLCVTHDIWGEVKKATSKVLESVTLQELVWRWRQRLYKND
jgi:Rrf2 family cysteine metabolism transcriptional repressor